MSTEPLWGIIGSSHYGVWRVKTVGLTRMVKESHSLQMLRWKLPSRVMFPISIKGPQTGLIIVLEFANQVISPMPEILGFGIVNTVEQIIGLMVKCQT